MGKAKGSSSSPSLTSKALEGLGSLVKLLPTGTVFIFQFLNPALINNGDCSSINRYLSGFLIGICSFSSFFSSFTDSYKTSDGTTYYGVATPNGLWPNPWSLDLSSYKLRVGDFVHAFMTLLVFAVVSLMDTNTVECFDHKFESDEKLLLMVVPPVVGAVASGVFMLFPNKRHGIGYLSTDDSSMEK